MQPVVFVTRHGKERLARPLLEARGLSLLHVERDTDQLGTFTGTVPRTASARETARVKARWGLEAVPGARLALASEGSFGPHPDAPFVTLAHELVLLVDAESGREFEGTDASLDSTFARAEVRTLDEARAFAAEARFPSHGLFVDRAPVDTEAALDALVEAALAARGLALVESDLRAHRNPTRQQAITRALERCLERYLWRCPACHAAGCLTEQVLPGLPCEACGAPTRLPGAARRRCLDCGHDELEALAGHASPGRCDVCNP